MHRVVITGIGVVAPVGIGKEAYWQGLLNGYNAAGPITQFDTTNYKAKIACEVKDFDPELYMGKKDAKRYNRYCQFAVAAATMAVDDAQIDFNNQDRYRIGIEIGTGTGGIKTFENEHEVLIEKGPDRVSPLMVPKMIDNMAAGAISMKYEIYGPSLCQVTACAAGGYAIGDAYRNIKHGYWDVALAGGSESCISPVAMAGFTNMTAISDSNDPNTACVPFDKRRTGLVMGEGAAILVMESLENAQKRNAHIYAELVGYGATSDAYHITSPHPEGLGAAMAIEMALKEADLQPQDVDYINAHGTGTPLNDKYETAAIKKSFGEYAYRVPISSTKSMTGHLMGAAGAIEAVASVMAIRDNQIPPTINYQEPDPDCDLDYVPNQKRAVQVDTVLSNSLGFGGHNAALLFKRFCK